MKDEIWNLAMHWVGISRSALAWEAAFFTQVKRRIRGRLF
jgi:hypothetical protein